MTETTDIALTFAPDNPVEVLTNPEQFDALLGRIAKEVADHVPDLETAKGRAAIKSLAYKVTRTKTALDDAGKELNATKRAEIDAVDAVRRDVRAKLDALAETARAPLDAWEAAEAERKVTVDAAVATIDRLAITTGSSREINTAIAELDDMEFDADVFRETLEIAVSRRLRAREAMETALALATKAEADAAELETLRAAERKRQEEADAKAAAEVAAEKAKREEEAAANAAKEAEAKRHAEIAAAEKAAADKAAADTKREADAKIAAAQAEAKRLQGEADARMEAERVAAEEQAKRDKDRAHRGKIMGEAKDAIIALGADTELARKIVLAIVAGEVPHVTLRF